MKTIEENEMLYVYQTYKRFEYLNEFSSDLDWHIYLRVLANVPKFVIEELYQAIESNDFSKFEEIKMKDNVAHLKLLIAALRSGEYKQNNVHLMRTEIKKGAFKYDPFGVMCDVYHLHTKSSRWIKDGNDFWFFTVGLTNPPCYSYPPREVTSWFGLNKKWCEDISTLHSAGSTFAEIADILEEEFFKNEE